MGSVEKRKKRKMKNYVCWCVWVGNWCVGVCGLVTQCDESHLSGN